MALTISIPKSPDDLSLNPLLTVTRAALGLGLGLLVADRIKRPARQATAIALMSIGTLAAVPFLLKLTLGVFNRADTERGSRNRLRTIRDATGYHSDSDVY
jgi:hypothetical protein